MFSLLSTMLFPHVATASPAIPPEAEDLGKGFHLHLERNIDASPESVWKVLADDYVDLAAWSTSTSNSRAMSDADLPEGFTPDPRAPVIGRVLMSGRFGEVSETLVLFDAAERTYRFAAGGLPKPMAFAGNTHTVHDVGDGTSRVTFDLYIVPKGVLKLFRGKLEKTFTKGMTRTLDELAVFVETGAPAVVVE